MNATILAALILGQTSVLPTRVEGGQPLQAPAKWPTHADVASSAPFAIFIGTPARRVQGLTVAQDNYTRPDGRNVTTGILVSWDGERCEILPANATDGQIRRAAGIEVSRQASPFSLPAKPTADDSGPWLPEAEQARLKALWPRNVAMPPMLAFYQPTKWVQRSAVTDFPQESRQNVLTIGLMSRPLRKPYHLPGGLDGIAASEWQSHTAAIRGTWFTTFSETVDSSIAYGGKLRRINRTFEDGATFFDLLTNRHGEPFELRAIVYNDGEPEPMVLFKNADAAPAGYVRVKSAACLKCHSEAGAVSYADGNAPGGGKNFSFPLMTKD